MSIIDNNRKIGDNRREGDDIRMHVKRSILLAIGNKVDKEEAKYVEGRNHCGKCQFWDVGNSCQLVEGRIDADDGCRFYKEANL